jgi:hypothetical protein
MRDFRDAKTMAHALRDALKDKGVEASHSEALELIAKAFGYDNWNILAAKIDAAKSPASGVPTVSPAEVEGSGSRTLYCTFCGKSQYAVRKLIAGPAVYICDECVQLCTEIVNIEDPYWSFLELLRGGEKGGGDAYSAASEHLRSRSTEDVVSYVERSTRGAEHNRLLSQYIRRRLSIRTEAAPVEDDIPASPEFAYLDHKSREELLVLQNGAQEAMSRCEAAVHLGTSVLARRTPTVNSPGHDRE